jgi:isoleucyl-tRNA synthetase
VKIYADNELLSALQQLGDELRFVFITSDASAHTLDERPDDAVDDDGYGYAISVSVSQNNKCVRCWHRRDDVGSVDGHPEICGRCADNVDGAGEQRIFA